MAKKKIVSTPHKMIDASTSLSTTEGMVSAPASAPKVTGLMKNAKLLYGVVALLAVSALLIANKSWVVSGVVNNKPVWSWELNKTMTDRFGKQTLEGIISERLIADEANKQGVVVSKEDIDKKQSEILKTLGGNVSVDELLKYQGITRNDFDNQIKLQLTVQKILGKDLVITEDDVDRFVGTNAATLTATTPAELRVEARQAILDAKVGEKLQSWFLELKNKAKVLRFL